MFIFICRRCISYSLTLQHFWERRMKDVWKNHFFLNFVHLLLFVFNFHHFSATIYTNHTLQSAQNIAVKAVIISNMAQNLHNFLDILLSLFISGFYDCALKIALLLDPQGHPILPNSVILPLFTDPWSNLPGKLSSLRCTQFTGKCTWLHSSSQWTLRISVFH